MPHQFLNILSSSSALTGNWVRRIYLAGCVSIIVSILLPCSTTQINAQAVHPDVFLDRSNATTHTQLAQLKVAGRPQIGLFYSERTLALNKALEPSIQEAVQLWELFLVGMELPYRVMEDTSLSRPIDDNIRLLIMPGVEVLSDEQKGFVKDYLKRGGGLIASGRMGFFDERGVLQNDRFFKEVFGAEPSIDLPDSLNGLLQSLQGGHMPTNGIPPGFLLNITRPAFGMAVLPLQSQSMGSLMAYQQMGERFVEEALKASTLLLKGEYEAGRFVWLGFNPQDVSLDPAHQAVYQGLMLNAMAYVSRTPMISVRRWPHGFTSASGFAVLPTLGYRPYAYHAGMDLILSALENSKVAATFFMITSRANDHPDIIERIVAQNELALTSDTDEMLAKQPRDLQHHRIRAANETLRRFSPEIKGFYPPGGFYDPNTLRVLIDMDLDYMLSDARTLHVPVFLQWEDELDYRDSLLTGTPWVADADSIDQN
ncbi:MAG: polysaccharide deacetylase family protein, partial [Chloroflexota bacterium]